jgi:hypothetical protein
MNSHANLLHPVWDMNHPFVQHIHSVYAICSMAEETDHIYVTFITVYCYNYFIFSLLVPNL